MTADELETWLKEEQSESSGWAKDDGSGETVGHERFAGLFIQIIFATDFYAPVVARSLRF